MSHYICNVHEMRLFKVIFYTKDSFVNDARLKYDGGDVYALHRQDYDFWSFFEACDLVKGMDSSFNIDDVKLWWKHEYGCLEKDLKPLVNDEDATMLTLCAEKSNCDVEIYTKPMLSMDENTYIERLIEKRKGHESIEENESAEDSESIEDSLDGIHFEDSEEERMHDFYEDIDEWLNIRVDNGGSRRDPVDDTDTSQRKKKVFTTVEMDKEHVIKDDYMTDELDSMTKEDSFDDKPAVIRFDKEEKLRKDFIFKVGMKFSSLKQFKKVVLEHNVLNGREVRFTKNDGNRCRIVCKHKLHCVYAVLCIRVLRTTSFKIKTLFQKHKCGKKFFNKNVNADWVFRVIVDNLKKNLGMKLNEVVEDVRLRFAIEIT